MRSLLSQYWFFFRHYIVLSVQVKTDFSYDEKTLAFFESYMERCYPAQLYGQKMLIGDVLRI